MEREDPTRPQLLDRTTLSEDEDANDIASLASPGRLALVLAWSRDEPWRVGEVFFLPSDPGLTVWLGRGPSSGGEATKGVFGQQRPGQWAPCPPITARAISRHQVSFRRTERAHLARNEGKCALFRNGIETTQCELAPGDLLQLGKQLLLFVCLRRDPMPDRWNTEERVSSPFGLPDPYGLVGESPGIWQVRGEIVFAAARPDHVMISGQSGCGKELVASAIHALSSRGKRRMVSRNAATLPETLIDAELFGNAKSYPNPGMAERAGLVGEAHGSALFLDEIAELPEAAQSHLLRVLDRGEYQRLGDAQTRTSNFRLIAATSRELSSLMPELLARLTFRVIVPNLNARKEDVPLLVRHCLRRLAERGDPAALDLFPGRDPLAEPKIPLSWIVGLFRHEFRTNVRELQAMILRALATPESAASWGKWEAPIESDGGARAASRDSDPAAQAIQESLDANNGSIERTWRALGLSSRFSLLRLIKKYGLEVRRRPAQRGHPTGLV